MDVEGYEVKRELGKGGMATVYVAVQESFDREVALKVMSPQLVADSTFAERFLREARIVAHLAHPNIVSVYDVGVSHDNYFLAMELHTGGDLAVRIADGISHAETIDILRQIAAALHYAHSNGYVHRDIKPGNVLFSHHGHVVLTDFGIAKAADSSTDLTQVKRVVGESEMTKEGAIVGTPSYMSPEQARGQRVDGRADIYSLGIMLYEMLTRDVPYRSSDQFAVAIMHINEPLPTLPSEHAAFQPILTKLLAKDPNDRYQTGAELIDALDTLGRRIQAPKPSAEERRTMIVQPREVPKAARREDDHTLAIAGGVVGLVVVAAAAAYFLTSSPGETGDGAAAEDAAIAASTETRTTKVPGAPTDSDEARIADLLARAEEAITRDRLGTAGGALELFDDVFALDATNAAARRGVERVADRYLALAKARVAERRIQRARAYVDKVAEFAPGHPELPAVTGLVENAERTVKSQPLSEMRIAGLLGNAKRLLAEDKLTSPANENAYDKYAAVLELEPNHPDALEGIRRIASRYLQLASAAAKRGELDQAGEYIERAEQIAPSHPGLAAARHEVALAR